METMPGPSSSRRREKAPRATGADYAPILASVEGGMRRVVADIESTTPYRPTMRLEFGDDWPWTVVCWCFIDPLTGRAIVVRSSDGAERVVVLLADEMSEEVSWPWRGTTACPKQRPGLVAPVTSTLSTLR